MLVTYWQGVPLGADFDPSKPEILLGLILCSAFGLCLSIVIGVRWFGWNLIRFGPLSGRYLTWAFLGVPLALGCSFAWATLLGAFTESVEPQMFVQAVLDVDSAVIVIVASAYAVIGAPLLEEALFRGLMLPAMTSRLGNGLGMSLNALLFGVIHAADPWAVLPAAAIGLIACWLRVRSGWIGSGVLFHSMNNLCALMLLASGY